MAKEKRAVIANQDMLTASQKKRLEKVEVRIEANNAQYKQWYTAMKAEEDSDMKKILPLTREVVEAIESRGNYLKAKRDSIIEDINSEHSGAKSQSNFVYTNLADCKDEVCDSDVVDNNDGDDKDADDDNNGDSNADVGNNNDDKDADNDVDNDDKDVDDDGDADNKDVDNNDDADNKDDGDSESSSQAANNGVDIDKQVRGLNNQLKNVKGNNNRDMSVFVRVADDGDTLEAVIKNMEEGSTTIPVEYDKMSEIIKANKGVDISVLASILTEAYKSKHSDSDDSEDVDDDPDDGDMTLEDALRID